MEITIARFSIDLDLYSDWEEVKEALIETMFENADFSDIPDAFLNETAEGTEVKDCLFELNSGEDKDAIAAYIENTNDDDIRNFREAYQGKYNSMRDFAEQYAEDTGFLANLPESMRNYFDFDKFAEDLGHDFFIENGYVFRNI